MLNYRCHESYMNQYKARIWAFSNFSVGIICSIRKRYSHTRIILIQELFYIKVADKARYENSERDKVFKCKFTIEAAGLHVVATKDVERNHEGNLSTTLARKAMSTALARKKRTDNFRLTC